MARSGPIPHGTYGGYTNYECRCERCRKAAREAKRGWRSRSKPRPTHCAHCGGELPAQGPGQPRRFCGDRCSYLAKKARCACGRPRRPRSARCGSCARQLTVRVQYSERWRLIEQLWADGLTLREMADRLGIKLQSMGPAMARWRRLGLELPHRRPPEVITKMRAASMRARN